MVEFIRRLNHMKELIIISKRHGVKIVKYDDCDHDLVVSHNWHVIGGSKYKHTLYAMTHYYKPDGKRSIISMHRLILGTQSKTIDHIDRDGLNNQRSNIRFASSQLNRLNSKLNSNNKTGERNIYVSPYGKFLVNIGRTVNKKKINDFIGSYKTMSEAIVARDLAMREIFSLS